MILNSTVISICKLKGTAMGKKFAPAHANIFMAEWETSALASCKQKPTHYYRYLDDIWGVWPHSMEEFEQFLLTVNNHNPSIKLKSTTSITSVDFLDTTTYKGTNFQRNIKLDIKVFFKETDTHALLHKTSHHPKHTYKGLLKITIITIPQDLHSQERFHDGHENTLQSVSHQGLRALL